jgi:hypothetical protein
VVLEYDYAVQSTPLEGCIEASEFSAPRLSKAFMILTLVGFVGVQPFSARTGHFSRGVAKPVVAHPWLRGAGFTIEPIGGVRPVTIRVR